MTEHIYKGIIKEGYFEQSDDTIYIGNMDCPISYELSDLKDETVSVSYYIAGRELNEQELLEESIASLAGSVYARCEACYSEYTGYLWTNEDLMIGGHDLLEELRDNLGKYIYLKVIIHD